MKKVQVVALVATVQQNSVGRNKIKIQSDNDHNSWSEMNRTQQNTPVPGRAEPSLVALEETRSLRGENKQTVKQIFPSTTAFKNSHHRVTCHHTARWMTTSDDL